MFGTLSSYLDWQLHVCSDCIDKLPRARPAALDKLIEELAQ